MIHDTWRFPPKPPGVGQPYFARICFSTEPEFTPMRIGIPAVLQASATCFTRSSETDISWINPDFIIPACTASSARAIIKMDIRHQWDGYFRLMASIKRIACLFGIAHG